MTMTKRIEKMVEDNNIESKCSNPLEKVREKEENDFTARLLYRYCWFLVRYPFVIVIGVVVIFIVSFVLSTVSAAGAKPFPEFSNPSKGFEARGTKLASRERSYANLRDTYLAHNLSPFPDRQTTSRRRRRSLDNLLSFYSLAWYINSFFIVYEHADKKNGNLLTLDNMKSLCKLHREKILDFPLYAQYFDPQTDSHNVPNYIAVLGARSSCSEITANDVANFTSVLKQCKKYYHDGYYKSCSTNPTSCYNGAGNQDCFQHPNIPDKKQFAYMMYNTFQYFVDVDFVENLDKLQVTGSFDMINYWDTNSRQYFMVPLYEQTLTRLGDVEEGNVRLAAFKMDNFRFHLFQTEIVTQSLYAITAIILVILFIWFYSGSLFIGLMTLGCIIIALVISYFVYGRIFDITFFPFLNMVTLVFIVGIGADDAFVYTGIWEEAKQIYVIPNEYEHEKYLIKWTIHSLRHALLAMFVTSLTTAAAFYANISSVITSVKCFGLFSGTSIIVNYLLIVTLFPAGVIMHEKYFAQCMHCLCPSTCKARPMIGGRAGVTNDNNTTCSNKLGAMINRVSDRFFKIYLPKCLLKLRFLWIILLAIFGIGGAVVTFGVPGMNPSSSQDFQMFTSNSPLERFNLQYKKRFIYGAGAGGIESEVAFVFGLNAVDNGNHFDPDDKGSLVLQDQKLDIAAVQTWLLQFCQNLKVAPFATGSRNCDDLEKMFDSFAKPCDQGIPGCCNQTIPMEAKHFSMCFREALRRRQQNNNWRKPSFTDPLFDNNGQLRVFMLQAETIYTYSVEYKYNKNVYEVIDSWFDNQIKNVSSSSFQNGWWHTYMHFYDLQASLFEGSKQSLGIAIGVAFFVILCTTFNFLLSLYSIITIFFIISVTIGVLVLSGWELNIMESIVFSVAAGLSADFTLHYSVAYKSAVVNQERVGRVKIALEHIGPAILMGAFTTFVSGVVVVPSHILVYLQMAQFLMLVMFVSWIYSTFFLLPLYAVIGPAGNTCQMNCPIVCESKQWNLVNHDNTVEGVNAPMELQ